MAQVVHPAIQGIFKEESTLFVGEGSMVARVSLSIDGRPTFYSLRLPLKSWNPGIVD